ncbi:MAG: hypothetical protein SW833_01220 [Cyanobacteriota bacterium]|nr:hypothetical protein [Cyanobacteriota bacterium]
MKQHLLFCLTLLVSTNFTVLSSVRAMTPEILISDGEGHHSQEGQHSQEGHHHGTLEIPDGEPIPSVDIMVYPDAERGWNLEVQLENFRFAPENINGENEISEGHAHLYLNDQQVTRLYGNWYHLPELPPGRNEIKVTLNANQHETLMHDGEPIEATTIVEVDEVEPMQMQN